MTGSQGLEVLGEVVGGDEGQDVGAQGCRVVVVVDLDGRLLDRAIHPLGLAVGPGVVGLGQSVLDAVGDADAVEDVRTEQARAGLIPVLGQVGEGHAVVGEHDVYLVAEDLDHAPQECRALHLAGAVVEFDMGELRDAVDRQEHGRPAFGRGAARSCRCGRSRSR